ncbi:AI-2E family transporter [Clostridium bornimense]|uniref:AI-2E family transporter n=1 Tax=Clostridium bornimense TaxID=1216932 RepID=UPI001C0FA635|nr:AI-2E family transporter [Clostridium bornimense]MBU5315343.1 AI-2E family transporter [Clostridium bornimense]
MKKLINNHIIYIKIVCTVIVAYILMNLIDNIGYFTGIFGKFYGVIQPFIFGLIIAYILNPIMKLFEKKLKFTRVISILFTYLIVIGVIAITSVYLFPKLYYSIEDFIGRIPYMSIELQKWINEFIKNDAVGNILESGILEFNPQILIPKISEISAATLNMLLTSIVAFTNSFVKFLFGFLVAIYILYDKEKIVYLFKKVLFIVVKEKRGIAICNVARNLHKMIGTYLGIKAIDSLIIAFIALVGLNILGSQYVLLLSVIVGVTNMIPYFGPFIGILTGFVINVFSSPISAVIIAIFLLLLQQFDAWFLDPKLIGNKVGLSPLLVILAVTLGGGFYGIIGMILASPVMSVIKIYAGKAVNKYKFKSLGDM